MPPRKSPRLHNLTPGLHFGLLPDGRLRALTALGAPETRVGPGVLPLLAAFAGGPASIEAAARAQGADAAAARRALGTLVEAGLLVPVDARGDPARGARRDARAEAAFAGLEVHRRLLTDVRRVERFGAAIAATVRGKRVVEVGTGTGILAVLAAKAGAARVTAIEETGLASLAREVVRANGVEGIVEVIEAPAREVTLPDRERGEVLVAELLGGDPLDEGLLSVVADARARLLAKGARVIPSHVEVLVQPLEARDDRLDDARRHEELSEAARSLGVDLGPVARALRAEGPPTFTAEVRGLEAGGGARLLGPAVAALAVDLERDPIAKLARASEDASAVVSLPIERSGLVSGACVFFRARLALGIELSNAPLAPETHWGQLVCPLAEPVPVKEGGKLRIRLRVDHGAISIRPR